MRETHQPIEVAFSANESNFEDKEKLRTALLKGMSKFGAINREGEHLVVDVQALKNWSTRQEINGASRKLNQSDMVKLFSEMTGVPKAPTEKENSEGYQEQPIMVLPKSLEDMQNQNESGYANRSQQALLQPWELGQKKKNWFQPIILDSGEQINLAEIAMTSVLHKLRAERNENGQLTVMHPQSGERVPFSSSIIKDYTGINPSITEKNNQITFDSNPLHFSIKYLPHLLKSGLLRQSDFRTLGGSRSAELGNIHERKLNGFYLNCSDDQGQHVRYFIKNRKGKIVGTEIVFDPEIMSAVRLDGTTIGIVKNVKDSRQVIVTINLLESAETATLRDSTRQRLITRGVEPTISNISSNTVVGENVTKRLIKKYSPRNYVMQGAKEERSSYDARLAKLKDYNKIQEVINEFFQQAGVGTHNLPWGEQLVLFLVVNSMSSEEKEHLLGLVKNHGLTGLRSFLAADYDKSLSQKIITMAGNIEQAQGREIFRKYSEILDETYRIERYLERYIPEASGPEGVGLIKENLLKKAAELLQEMVKKSLTGNQKDLAEAIKKLRTAKSDVMLFAVMCKNLAGELDLNKIIESRTEEKDSSSLTEEEKGEMREIFQANRIGSYPEELYEAVSAKFENFLAQPGHTFRILKEKDQIIAFLHFDRISEDVLYVGSLNLNPSAKDSPLAVAFLKSALEELGDRFNLKAKVWDGNPILKRYYTSQLGFQVDLNEQSQIDGIKYDIPGQSYTNLIRRKRTNEIELKKAA